MRLRTIGSPPLAEKPHSTALVTEYNSVTRRGQLVGSMLPGLPAMNADESRISKTVIEPNIKYLHVDLII